MPIYEYVCGDCRVKFETLVRRWGDAVSCPGCGSAGVEKQLSTFAALKASPSGPDFGAGCGQPEAGCGAGACAGGACAMPDAFD